MVIVTRVGSYAICIPVCLDSVIAHYSATGVRAHFYSINLSIYSIEHYSNVLHQSRIRFKHPRNLYFVDRALTAGNLLQVKSAEKFASIK